MCVEASALRCTPVRRRRLAQVYTWMLATHTHTHSLAILGWDCAIRQRRPGRACLAVSQRSLTWGEKIGGGTRNWTSWLELDWNNPPPNRWDVLGCMVVSVRAYHSPGLTVGYQMKVLLISVFKKKKWHHRRRTTSSDQRWMFWEGFLAEGGGSKKYPLSPFSPAVSESSTQAFQDGGAALPEDGRLTTEPLIDHHYKQL